MEIIMAIAAGILTMCAIYLILSKSILRIIIGTGLLSHAAHLLVMTMGGLKRGAALVLTAIVISFGVTAFFLVLAYRAYQELGTDNIEEMKGTDSND